MEYGIIVTGHGHFATGITSAVELIMGKPENYTAIDFPLGADVSELEASMNEAIFNYRDKEILIMCDLLGGSPCQTALKKAIESQNIHVIYGVNLGLILEMCTRIQYADSIDALFEGVIEFSAGQIGVVDLQHLHQ